MVLYTCPRCNYITTHKTKYKVHLKRKKICNPVISETNLQNEYIKYDVTEKLTFSSKNEENSTKNVELHKIPQNSTFSKQCKYCDKLFSRSDSLARHYKNCKDKMKTDEANENMKQLVKLLNEQKIELDKKNKQIEQHFGYRFGIALESIWNRFGIVSGSVWDRFGIVVSSFWH